MKMLAERRRINFDSGRNALANSTAVSTTAGTAVRSCSMVDVANRVRVPLEELPFSPIPRCDEKYDQMYRRLGYPRKPSRERQRQHQVASTEVDDMGSVDDEGEPIPMLEISERVDVYHPGEERAKMYQSYKGQLRVSVYINYGLLTVHIQRGRHLNIKSKQTCDSFVKLCLSPDEGNRTKCKTEVVMDTNHPVYDEKFSFELLESDLKKRLLISAWNRDPKRGKSRFLGCMSFGIQHISPERRTINGWYYLLTEDVGRRKHLKVASTDRRPQTTELVSDFKTIPQVSRDVLWMEPHIVIVRRSSLGYGFSLTGSCPATVCRVEAGQAAERAGLNRYDCIISINGLNVAQSSADNVARIISVSPAKIVLEVQRPHQVSDMDRSPWRPLPSSTSSLQIAALSAGTGSSNHGSHSGGSTATSSITRATMTTHDQVYLHRQRQQNEHHSDSELDVESKPKLNLGRYGNGTLPRSRKQPYKQTIL